MAVAAKASSSPTFCVVMVRRTPKVQDFAALFWTRPDRRACPESTVAEWLINHNAILRTVDDFDLYFRQGSDADLIR
jgi:hypothetical protein